MSGALKSQLTRDIVRFLLEERACATSDDARDALGVAAECVSAALLGADCATPPPALLPGDPSLMHLYCLGLANYEQIARAIATHRDNVAVAPEVVRRVPIDAAFDDAALEERFQSYVALLEQQGYFKGTTRDSAAWVDRVAKARDKFRSRFGAASVTTPTPTTTTTTVPVAPVAAAAVPQSTSAPSADAVARAEKFKAAGNALLQAQKYDAALVEYDQAIALNGHVAIYHANKAAALSFLNRHADAVDAAERAIRIDPAYTKAYSRLGLSLLALNRTREALAAYEEAARREPDNAQYATAVQTTRAKLTAAEPVVDEGDDADADDDDAGGDDIVGAARGAGGGGMPDLASLMSNPMVAQMMANPQMRAMAQQMMSDPNAMANLMNNPMLQSMMGGMGGGGGGAGRGQQR
jgi:tetratricopeptide (TPR) repeat protein